MFNKIRKNWYAEDFSYFVRNFGVFTLIFSAMTLIILQVMHSSLYTSVDEKLLSLSANPQDVIQLAVNRATEDVKDLNSESVGSSSNRKPTVSSNTEVILLDSSLNQLVAGNRFLGLDRVTFNKKDLNHIRQLMFRIAMGRMRFIE